MLKFVLPLVCLLVPAFVHADEEPPARIVGPGIDLHFIDHGIAGVEKQ